MEELIEILGGDAANLFITAFGGQVINIPANVYPAHRIAVAIGFDAALKLSSRWGKLSVSVPKRSSINLQDRNFKIKADRLRGMTLNELALKYQITSRQVSSILRPKNLALTVV